VPIQRSEKENSFLPHVLWYLKPFCHIYWVKHARFQNTHYCKLQFANPYCGASLRWVGHSKQQTTQTGGYIFCISCLVTSRWDKTFGFDKFSSPCQSPKISINSTNITTLNVRHSSWNRYIAACGPENMEVFKTARMSQRNVPVQHTH